MGKRIIISIGREFGSGGHEIAQELAKRLSLPLYDFNLLREIADVKQVSVKNLEPYDEVPRTGLSSRTVRGLNNSPQINIANMQFDFLRTKAQEGESFVVVGRCAEQILKEFDGLVTIFIMGDTDKKIARVKRIYGLEDDKKAQALIEWKTKQRKAYHNYYCDTKWGDSKNYELSINSSKLGEDATTDILEIYIRKRMDY